MSKLPSSADVVIVGGGVMGASTAYHLALKGCPNVLLLEKEDFFGTQATGRCAGGIRYQFSTEINVHLSLHSLPMLQRFEEELGQVIDLRYCGYLFLLTSEQDIAAFRQNVALQNRLGVQTAWLTPQQVADMIPLANTNDVLAGTCNFTQGEGLADPGGVVQGYVSGARRLGARLLTEVEVTGIEVSKGRISGLETNKGRVTTATLVNAAGPWAGVVGGMAGVDIPIEPVRRQITVTAPIPQIPPDFPFVIDFARSLYFHREGQGLLTGMSDPDQPVGFGQSVDADWELTHLQAAVERLPLMETAGIFRRWAGLYQVSPDAHPILGRIPQLPGFYCVGGFSGHGFMHGPVCGLLLAEEILDGAAHTLDISSLYIDRFAQGQPISEYNVI